MQHHSGTGILNWKFLDTEPWIVLSIRRAAGRLYCLCSDRYDSNAACIFLHRKYPISVLEKENGMLDSDGFTDFLLGIYSIPICVEQAGITGSHNKYRNSGSAGSDNDCKINFCKETGCLNEKDNRNNKRNVINSARRSRVRTFVKKALEAILGGNVENAVAACRTAESELARAAQKGAVDKRKASRIVSRLNKKVKAIQA